MAYLIVYKRNPSNSDLDQIRDLRNHMRSLEMRGHLTDEMISSYIEENKMEELVEIAKKEG